MKSRKVLLGLFLGVFAAFSGNVTAQQDSGSGLIEVGPDNIGGRVTSLIVDKRDHTHHTLFAGAASGGLFVKSSLPEFSDYAAISIWEHIPYIDENGKEITLPISAMVQLPNDDIIIATGESSFTMGSRLTRLAPMGRGLFRFNPNTKVFSPIANTQPADAKSPWASVNKIAFAMNYNQSEMYFFVATQKGLYRWNITNESDWNTAPVLVSDTVPVYDVMPVSLYNMLYYTTATALFRQGNMASNTTPVDISRGCEGIREGNVSRIFLASSDPRNDSVYIYAMVCDEYGYLKSVYLTKNQSTWDLLTTSTITPFSENSAHQCGAITVDPSNPDRIFVGGSSIWSGQGYIDHAIYQWSKVSSDEYQFYTATGLVGNYMAGIYAQASFVHSGINQIVGTVVDYDSVNPVYYIATDGGVFVSKDGMNSFSNINRGLNNVQCNSVAVCPDGSVLTGATNNAAIFIGSRSDFDGGVGDDTWYDHDPAFNRNHMGSEIFAGNGGGVAASRFYQYAPSSRRNIIVSGNNTFGRSYTDYDDYTNTQTWTVGSSFIADNSNRTSINPSMFLWETKNDTKKKDSIQTIIDTLAFAYRGSDTIPMKPGTTLLAGDSIWVASPAHAGYPFKHVLEKNITLKQSDTLRVKNPIQNHLFVVSRNYLTGMSTSYFEDVTMTWMPTDFRKVWVDNLQPATEMFWAKIYSLDLTLYPTKYIADITVSNDGNTVFVAVNDEATNESFIVRVVGIIDSVDYSLPNDGIEKALNLGVGRWLNRGARISSETLKINNGSELIPRRISSLNIDRRNGTDAVLVTLEGHDNDYNNVLYIKNATSATPKIDAKNVQVNGKNIPVYSGMIEYTTGNVYLGTEEGIFTSTKSSFDSPSVAWNEYGNFTGVPVVAMCQQTEADQIVRYTGHTGVAADKYVFPKTKYPYAMYFATYGRGIFLDTTYVTDMSNNIVEPRDTVTTDIPRVFAEGNNSVKVFPNPVVNEANIELTAAQAGNAQVRIYDLSGKLVYNENWGRVAEGTTVRQINCQNFRHGMYLINITVGRDTATSKLIVR